MHPTKRIGARSQGRVIVAALAIACMAMIPGVATADDGRSTNLVESGRPVTFGALGVAGRLAVGTRATGELAFPRNAAQGPDLWYTLSVDVSARFQPESAGSAYVSISTNDRTAAQLKFQKEAGKPAVYSAVGLVNGSERVEAVSENLTVRFENYLRDEGVRAGQVDVEVELETTTWTGLLPEVTIDPASRMDVTRVSPYPLSLEVRSSEENRDRSEHVVEFIVRGLNGRTVDDVVVLARPGPGLRVIGPAQLTFGRVNEPRSGRFTVRYSQTGPQRLELAALSNENRPSVVVDIESSPQQQTPWSSVVGGVLALSGAGFIASAVVRRRQR